MVLDPETRRTKWLIIDDHSDSAAATKRGRVVESKTVISTVAYYFIDYRMRRVLAFRSLSPMLLASFHSFMVNERLMKRDRCASSLLFFSILRLFDIYLRARYIFRIANMINDREPDRGNNIFLATRPANEKQNSAKFKIQRQRRDFKVQSLTRMIIPKD